MEYFLMHSYTQVGVGRRAGFMVDTLSNLQAANGHLLRQIFYLKVIKYFGNIHGIERMSRWT